MQPYDEAIADLEHYYQDAAESAHLLEPESEDMDNTRREQLEVHLLELCEDYGPWSVLWATAQILRPVFVEAEPPKPKHPRKGRDKAAGGDRKGVGES